ncbi:hypothetical protein G7046_g8942 [Stylonectria norvegica]|nr:hypothetical protein G7046_g8942 [Stylonectria norvegica]
MVVKLAAEEEKRKAKAAKASVFSFWNGPSGPSEGRWAAEEAVVQERVRRTKELVEDVAPVNMGPLGWFKA